MPEILIVGAGPTGLTLACELAVRGVPFRLLERCEGPHPGSKAKGLHPRTLEVFERMGIVRGLVAAGYIDMPFRQYHPNGSHVDLPRQGMGTKPDVPWPSPLLVPQWRTEAALLDRLEALGGAVEYNTELMGFESDEYGVCVRLLKDGKQTIAEGSWLVGCDGSRSVVRRVAGLNFADSEREDACMLVGDMQVEGLDRAHWHVWRPRKGGFVSIAPLSDANFQVQIAVASGASEETSIENFQHLIQHCTGRDDIRVSNPTWMSVWRAGGRLVDRYRSNCVLLAGDAAHIHPPAGCQGLNTGIQDAFNLGWKLAAVQRGADAALLDTYEAERLPVARQVLAFSGRSSARVPQPTTPRVVPQHEDAFHLSFQYRNSPISQDRRAAPGHVRAGDRAPDATGLRDVTGMPLRLFDILCGPRATLVGFGQRWLPLLEILLETANRTASAACIVGLGERSPAASPVRCFFDSEQIAHMTWDVQRPTLFVVRPDGVIGFATEQSQITPVLTWMRLAGLVR